VTQPTGTPQRRSLRRAQKERLLFGVCGGLGAYFNLDPTVIRVAFVVAGLIPPIGGALIAAYAAMVFIIPVESAAELAGRDQVRANLSSLRSEAAGLAETVLDRITGEPREATPPPAPPAPLHADPANPAEHEQAEPKAA